MLAAFIGVSAYELLQFLEEDVSVELAGVAPHLFAVGWAITGIMRWQ